MELPLARVLAKVECRGIQLDSDRLREIGVEVGSSIAALEKEIHAMAGMPFNISSPKQLAECCSASCRCRSSAAPRPARRPTPTRWRSWRRCTRAGEDRRLPRAVEAEGDVHRRAARAGQPGDRAPAHVVQPGVAATGRLSSSNPNLQNIPIRSEVGRRIRQAFVAKPGHVLVSADYSQIELRILAHYSKDPAFVDAFARATTSTSARRRRCSACRRTSVTPEHRRIAKAINFGLAFGQTDFGLAQVLRIPRAQARTYIQSYFARYAGVKAYMDRAILEARETQRWSRCSGRRRPLPEIRATRAQDRAYAERIARNTPIQGSAADLLKLAMIRVDDAIEAGASPSRRRALLLTVHDELVFELPQEAAPEFKHWVKGEMEAVYKLDVPLVVDVGSGTTWSEAH
jgi:DNA polymerase-1